MKYLTLTEAKAKFSEVVEKAKTVVTKMGKPAAIVTPYAALQAKRPLLGCMQGEGKMMDDFNGWPDDIARALGILD